MTCETPHSKTTIPRFEPGDALLVVDVQNDFCPGGNLPVEGGDTIVPVLNQWIKRAKQAGIPIIASRDWHPPGHVSFSERGGPWPTHCVRETEGAAFHPDLALPDDTIVIDKGTDTDRDAYSAFDETDLPERLREMGVRRLWVGGLAQDVCVRASVLDGVKEGFDVHLIADATRPVNAESGTRALQEMARAGATVKEVPA